MPRPRHPQRPAGAATRGTSDVQKRELWDRWKAGESISAICRALGRPPGSIFTIVKSNGGYVPPLRRRRPGLLSFTERESISRGLARGDSLREISRALGRAASTVSREIARNKGTTGRWTPRTGPGTAPCAPRTACWPPMSLFASWLPRSWPRTGHRSR
ncbi:helix-turn-helix domain-containing protein [Kitasatospora sp. NBC_00070]|uniref:helix-turn-helix domain-containing protein n=1 Tax=Kitasatospora sp. NBC_00070 TaxID=2975962 RepID=UPI003860267F